MTSAINFLRLCVVLFAVACLPRQAWPQEVAPPPRSIFAINNIAVDVTAASAAAARQSAIAQARRLGFTRLFEKLVAREDLELEPPLTNAELADLVYAIDIRQEKTSTTRYVAAMSVTFDEDKVVGLLRRLGVTYTDSDTPPIVLLPLATYGGVPLLVSPDNVWLLAWERSATRASSLVRYVLPDASVSSQRFASALSVPHAPPEQLIQLLQARGASDVLVARADIVFDLTTRRYRADFDVRRGPQQQAFLAFSHTQDAEESPLDMLERAIAQIDGELSALWKRQLLVEFTQARTVEIAATFDSPDQWRRIRAGLQNTRRLRSLTIAAIGLDEAEMSARFFGQQDALETELAQQGLALDVAPTGLWSIRVSDEAGPVMKAEAVYVDPLAGTDMPSEPGLEEDGLIVRDDEDFGRLPWQLGFPETEDKGADEVSAEERTP